MIRWVKFSQYLHVNGHCLSRNVNTMSPSKPVIQVTPTVSLFDQKVDIKLTGLPKHSEVTVHAMFESPSRRSTTRFVSSGHFMTDRHGEVNLADRPSEGGTYTGELWTSYAFRVMVQFMGSLSQRTIQVFN